MRHALGAKELDAEWKIRIYAVSIVSVLNYWYGCETSQLTTQSMKTLNGVNVTSMMFAHFTGKSILQEARLNDVHELQQFQNY